MVAFGNQNLKENVKYKFVMSAKKVWIKPRKFVSIVDQDANDSKSNQLHI